MTSPKPSRRRSSPRPRAPTHVACSSRTSPSSTRPVWSAAHPTVASGPTSPRRKARRPSRPARATAARPAMACRASRASRTDLRSVGTRPGRGRRRGYRSTPGTGPIIIIMISTSPTPRTPAAADASVHDDRGADRGHAAAPQEVHGGVGDAGAAVRGGRRRDAAGAVHGDAAVEVLRPVQVAEWGVAHAVDLPVDRERARRRGGDRRAAGRAGVGLAVAGRGVEHPLDLAVLDDEEDLAPEVDLEQVARRRAGRRAGGRGEPLLRLRAGDAVAAQTFGLLERHHGLAGELAVATVALPEPVADVAQPLLEAGHGLARVVQLERAVGTRVGWGGRRLGRGRRRGCGGGGSGRRGRRGPLVRALPGCGRGGRRGPGGPGRRQFGLVGAGGPGAGGEDGHHQDGGDPPTRSEEPHVVTLGVQMIAHPGFLLRCVTSHRDRLSRQPGGGASPVQTPSAPTWFPTAATDGWQALGFLAERSVRDAQVFSSGAQLSRRRFSPASRKRTSASVLPGRPDSSRITPSPNTLWRTSSPTSSPRSSAPLRCGGRGVRAASTMRSRPALTDSDRPPEPSPRPQVPPCPPSVSRSRLRYPPPAEPGPYPPP